MGFGFLKHLPSPEVIGHVFLQVRFKPITRAGSYKLDEGIHAARGTKVESYLGHAEAWVDRGSGPRTEEARRANAAFVEDERNFIDMERSTIFFGKEHTIIDNR